MPKTISLIGPPKSGKTFFLIAKSIALEKEDIGYITPLHFSYGPILDAAFAQQTPDISSSSQDYVATLYHGKKRKKKIEIVEKIFSKAQFTKQPDVIGKIIANSHLALVFIDAATLSTSSATTPAKGISQDTSQPRTQIVKTTKDYRVDANTLAKNAMEITNALLKEFKPWWKFRRKVKKIIFITPKINPEKISVSELESDIRGILQAGLDYVEKRKVRFSFHFMDLVLETGGVNIKEVIQMLPEILGTVT